MAVRLEGPVQADAEARLQLHLSLDNYATHKHPDVTKWLVRHQRFDLHWPLNNRTPIGERLRWSD